MIRYKSTRGDKKLVSFSESILKGIAYDGGLFVPEKIPLIPPRLLKIIISQPYNKAALEIFKVFETDFGEDQLKKAINEAYGKNFDSKDISPLVQIGDFFVLELFHGPTYAFKDLALQLMPRLFRMAVDKDNRLRIKQGLKPLKHLILVATSGDTGKAALEGYKDLKDIKIVVLYPKGGVSPLQEKAMLTQTGNNVMVVGIKGNFDDCQFLVKKIFADKGYNRKIYETKSTVLSSANSINWGRIIPQIVYYFYAYGQLVKKKVIRFGHKTDFVIPTGNFGNILAGFYAYKMGLPVGKLICASNANNVLSEFLESGVYRIDDRSLVKTPSPSMDILIASNIERFLYEITKDPKQVGSWTKQLKEKKRFGIGNKNLKKIARLFSNGWKNNEQTLKIIKDVYINFGYLPDPHTAVALGVADNYKKRSKNKVVVLSTAHWAKFVKDVYAAIFKNANKNMDEKGLIKKMAGAVNQPKIPSAFTEIFSRKKKFDTTVDANTDTTIRVIDKFIL